MRQIDVKFTLRYAKPLFMTYETMDWEAEAKRVKRAFGLVEECEFGEMYWLDDKEGHVLAKPNECIADGDCIFDLSDQFKACLQCHYWKNDGRTFGIFVLPEDDYLPANFYDENQANAIGITIGWDGTLTRYSGNSRYLWHLTRALYILDLLTTEVEEKLEVTISAHQKLEWTIEREHEDT